MTASSQDRRKQRRKQVNLRVEFELASVKAAAVTVDVSETGLFLNTTAQAAPGDEVKMRIHQNPPLPPVDALGMVRRAVKAGQGPLPGLGIEFRGPEGVDIIDALENPPPIPAAGSPAAAAVSAQTTAAAQVVAEKQMIERLARAKDVAFDAEKKLYHNDFKGAYSGFKLASVLDPKNAEYQRQVKLLEPKILRDGAINKFDKAKELVASGDPAGAISLLREVVAADAKNAPARYELARLLFTGLRPDDTKSQKEVLELIRRAILLDPGKVLYQILAGRVTQILGDMDGARLYYRTALKLEPSSEAAKKGLASLDSGDKKWVG